MYYQTPLNERILEFVDEAKSNPALQDLAKTAKNGAVSAIDEFADTFRRRLFAANAVTLVVAVVGSAVISGAMLQWFDDNVVSKHIVPRILEFIAKHFPGSGLHPERLKNMDPPPRSRFGLPPARSLDPRSYNQFVM
jgi:hypothetical protein